ncbi:MAG: class I SAM-dependent methyltransferase [Oscillospiraceae bacterium]|nr:class I SAM-dependent methyltransferase [Oscillospiraceae bacterium]
MAQILIYDTAALYNQNMDESAQQKFQDLYEALFTGYDIKTIHDCSIGAGGTTLPLAKIGYIVSGSDLNENLLNRAKINFHAYGYAPKLFISDFREIDKILGENVDCIISTGNSLPHVDLCGFKKFLSAAHSKLNDNGLLFFDIRNWDVLAHERAIIHIIDPRIMTSDEHQSTYLLFNWHDNGSVTFSFVTSVDKKGKHEHHDVIACPVYYPLLRNDIIKALSDAGFALVKYIDLDDIWMSKGFLINDKTGNFDADFDVINWYGVLAQKVAP